MSSDEEDVLCVLAIADAVSGRKLRFRVRPYLLERALPVLSIDVQIDGSIDFGQNFDFEVKPLNWFTESDIAILRLPQDRIPLDVNDILANITGTKYTKSKDSLRTISAKESLTTEKNRKISVEESDKTEQRSFIFDDVLPYLFGERAVTEADLAYKSTVTLKKKKAKHKGLAIPITDHLRFKDSKQPSLKSLFNIKTATKEDILNDKKQRHSSTETTKSTIRDQDDTNFIRYTQAIDYIPTSVKKKKKHKPKTTTTKTTTVTEDSSTEDPKSAELLVTVTSEVSKTSGKSPPEAVYDTILRNARTVRNDSKIQDFTLDVFKQALNVFESLRQQINDSRYSKKFDLIARSYKNTFEGFVNETQDRRIMTRLGTQKVVLNIIETSNRHMKRLINFLLNDIEKHDALRTDDLTTSFLMNKFDNAEQFLYEHACEKFNICTTKYSLTTFISDYITVVLQVDNGKLKQSMDAITEVLRDVDVTKIADKKKFVRKIEYLEAIEASTLRSLLWILKNMLVNKNQPLVVQEKISTKAMQKTIATLALFDALDVRIPANEENMLEWNDLLHSLVQWANNKRRDIIEIMEAFVQCIFKKGINKMDHKATKEFRKNFEILLS